MNRVIRIGLAVLVGLPLMSLLFLFPRAAGTRAEPPRRTWEGPPRT
jgi:hypothetical protein